MIGKFTNDYTILKDILKAEYTFVLSLLFSNFDDIIHLLKEKQPFYGEILEYLYMSLPTYYNKTHDTICQTYRYIDDVVRILYKNHRKNQPSKFKNDVHNICEQFHIDESEFEYYYFVALFILALENGINEDAFNLYSQLDNSITENVEEFLDTFMKTLSTTEFQCIFYNHLEDVYHTNRSDDKMLSVLHKDNYSFFMDNHMPLSMMKLEAVDGVRYPVVITKKNVYNIINNAPHKICENTFNETIFGDNVVYVAMYNVADKIIQNFIPIFYFFGKFENLSDDICQPLYEEFKMQCELDDSSGESFSIIDSDYHNLHYYVDQFTVYQF